MVDAYTKAVLILIAIAPSIIVIRPILRPAPVTAQGVSRGSSSNPCYVVTPPFRPLEVTGKSY